jgi:pyruvate/2-oxoglutarate dehydrogenase complex dihydrolipoamide dehydrogenase (E3) component
MSPDLPGAESLVPDDAHDELLRSRVHPTDWVNPEPASRYHLVVLGGGTAGLVAAAGAAGLGARVALVERALLGGDCLNTGCVPSKGVIRAGRAAHAARNAGAFGVNVTGVEVDFAAAMGRVRGIRAGIARHDSAERFRDLGIDVFLGDARFTSGDRVDVNGTTLRFRKAVLATGARPWVPPMPGLDRIGSRLLTSDNVFALTELPTRMAVIGAGPIGSELAQAFQRLGTEVSLFDHLDRPLPNDDPDASAVVRASMEEDGIQLHLGISEGSAEPTQGGVRIAWKGLDGPGEVEVDAVLVSTGRRARVEGLGLDAAGVRLQDGKLITDDFLRTTNKRIYASGDVVGGPQFTHAADAMSRLVIGNALFGLRGRQSRLTIPWATYTDPEVAHVGPKWADLDVDRLDTFTVQFDDVDRAQLEGERGFVRAHVLKGTDKLVAATTVGAEAGDSIAVFALMLQQGLGLGTLSRSVLPYPSRSMALKQLGDAWGRTRLTPGRKRLLERWFGLFS